jgi:hypothetical protein
MKKIFLVLLMLLIAMPVWAVTDFEQITVLDDSVVTFTAAKVTNPALTQPNAQEAFCTLSGNSIMYTTNGTTPTASVGHLTNIGDKLIVAGYSDIIHFQAITTSSTHALLSCSYYFEINPMGFR